MKRWKCLLRISVLLLVFCFVKADNAKAADIQDFVTYEFNETNGLPTGEANTVLQTGDGYVWIGSYGGLIRYDGTTFRNYSSEGAIASSSIRMLFEDSQGRLWIGTNDQGVYLYEDGKFTLYQNANRQEFLSVRDFAEGEDGTIYVGTTSGLAKVEGTELVAVSEKTSGMTVYSLAVDEKGTVWACIDDGIALLVSGDDYIGSFDSGEYLGAPLYCADAMADGSLYLGTSENLIYRVTLLNENYGKDSFSFAKLNTGELSTINDIGQDAKGNVWVAALNGTGYFEGGRKWRQISEGHVSAANVIAFDYEGNVWIASSSYGIIHLVDSIYYNINETAGLSETAINTVAVVGGSYYLGTDTGLIVLDSSYRPVHNELTELLEGERVRNILCDRDGNIWIGTYYEHGLLLYEPKTEKITSFTEEQGLSNHQIRMVMECSDGSIAVASQNGVSILKDHKVVRTYGEEEGLFYPIILCLCEGEDGTIYAGSDGQGFYAIHGDEVKHYGFDEGLDSGVVLRMLADKDGQGLFISAGNSLYYWDYKEFKRLDNYERSPGSVFDMYLVKDQLWLLQSNGINVLDRERLLSGEKTAVQIIGVAEGMTGTLNANTWNTCQDDTFYICTSNGLSILPLARLEKKSEPFCLIVNQAVVDDQVHEMPDQVKLARNAKRLTFDFAALSYTGRKLEVRYRLKGFDEEFNTVTNEQPMRATYTNLSGGEYEFIIEILDGDSGEVAASCTLGVNKSYRLWEHMWFWLCAALVLLLAVILVIWLCIYVKTLRLKRQQEDYRRIIEESLKTFANAIDAKDKYTNGHSIRVAAYTLEIARRLKLSKEDQERIYYIALLHDIGKIGIADEILNKPGKLTDEERKIIMSHPAIGGEILKDFTSIPGISEGARYHHERYDGNGYNEGLKGEEIPLFARIICVADSYDAMSSARCYRKSLDKDVIMEEFKKCSGTQFDPQIVEIMLQMMEEGKVPVELDEVSFAEFE